MEMKELLQRLRRLGNTPVPDSLVSKVHARIEVEKKSLSSQASSQSQIENNVSQREMREGASLQPRDYIGLAASTQIQSGRSRRGVPVIGLTPALSVMSLHDLAECCACEMGKYRRKEAGDDQYCLEILRRSVIEQDDRAWDVLRQQFNENLWLWIRRHPQREVAICYRTEQNYVDDAFTRFRRTVGEQTQIFLTLAEVLKYLHLCLNCTIADTLRAYSRPIEKMFPKLSSSQEPKREDSHREGELWEALKNILPNEKEQRIAYLHFHYNLKPHEIVRYPSSEFSSEAEIERIRCDVMKRILCNAEKVHLSLSRD